MTPIEYRRIHLPDAHQILIYPSSYEKLQTNPYRYVPLHGPRRSRSPRPSTPARRLAVPSGAAQQLVSGHGPRHGAHRPDGQPDHRRPLFPPQRARRTVGRQGRLDLRNAFRGRRRPARPRAGSNWSSKGSTPMPTSTSTTRRCSPPTTCSAAGARRSNGCSVRAKTP